MRSATGKRARSDHVGRWALGRRRKLRPRFFRGLQHRCPGPSIPDFIRPISYILPLTYSSDALRAVMLKGAGVSEIVPDLLFLVGFFILAFWAATLMLKREVG
ncbi:MAG: ABC transporter permease [Methanothrix sp.]|nr:ABC transporter permease [Methanothrix sp.]